MKKRKYPLHEACDHFNYCTSKEGGNRKDCGYCPLHPRAFRVFTPTFVLQCILTILIVFFIGALFCFLAKS